MSFLSPPETRGAARFAALAAAAAAAVASLLIAPARTARAQDDVLPPRYTLEDLGTVAGASVYSVEAMNVHGEVVGWSVNAATGNVRGFRSTPSGEAISLTDIGSRGGPNTYAYDINDAGQIVGHSQMSITDFGETGIVYRAFKLAPDETLTRDTPALGFFRFPTRDFSYAFGINNAGYVAGGNSYNGRDYPATLWGPGGEYLGIDDVAIGHRYRALDINDNLMLVGDAFDFASPFGGGSFWAWRATYPRGIIGPATNLIGFHAETIGGLNNAGVTVGSTHLTGTTQAFRIGPTQQVSASSLLGTLGGPEASAADINDLGQIVGASETASGSLHAFLYTLAGASEQMFDLNTLVDGLDPTWTLTYARAINERGQIAGVATVNGAQRMFRLTPRSAATAVPEPSTLTLLALGGGAAGSLFVAARRRKRATGRGIDPHATVFPPFSAYLHGIRRRRCRCRRRCRARGLLRQRRQ